MRPGTVVRLADGRKATVVYHGLDGYGVVFGAVAVDVDAILSGNGGLIGGPAPDDYAWKPEAMLRAPYSGASLPCVGDDYEVVDSEEAE